MPTYSGSRADRTLEILLKLKTDDATLNKTEKAILQNYNALKKVEDQANKTREKMEKLAQVGTKMALAGGAILAPFALSMKKYFENAKAAAGATGKLEPTAQKLADLSARWEKSQERLGKITADTVVPALEKALNAVEPLIAFIEKNPWIAGAIIGVGATLAGVGAAITLFAQTVSTLATVKGLLAAQTVAAAGGNTAAQAGLMTAAGVQSAIAGVVPIFMSALAAWAGAELGIIITNAFLGTDYTITDIANTAKLLLALAAKGLDQLLGHFGIQSDLFGSLSNTIGITSDQQNKINAIIADKQADKINAQAYENTSALGKAFLFGFDDLANAFLGLFKGGRASGGYVGDGFYRVGEEGKEFVMDNPSTTKAEGLLGEKLDQKNIVSAITGAFVYRKMLEQLLEQYMALVKAVAPLFSKSQRAAMEKAKYSFQPNDMYIKPGQYNDTYIPKMKDIIILPGQYPDIKFMGERANGGYMDAAGMYAGGERGREFVLNASATRSAESLLGGRLTQERVLSNITQNLQIGNGVTIMQMRKAMRQNNRDIMSGLMGAWS